VVRVGAQACWLQPPIKPLRRTPALDRPKSGDATAHASSRLCYLIRLVRSASLPARAPRPATAVRIDRVAEEQASPDAEDIPVPAGPGGLGGHTALGECPPAPFPGLLCGRGPLSENRALYDGLQQTQPTASYCRLKDGGEPWWRGDWTDHEHKCFLARLRRFQRKPPVPFPWGMFAKTFKIRTGYHYRNHHLDMVKAGVTMPFVLPDPHERPFKARKRKATLLPVPGKNASRDRKSKATEVTDEAEETALQEKGSKGASEEEEVVVDKKDLEEEAKMTAEHPYRKTLRNIPDFLARNPAKPGIPGQIGIRQAVSRDYEA